MSPISLILTNWENAQNYVECRQRTFIEAAVGKVCISDPAGSIGRLVSTEKCIQNVEFNVT
jgi:hypothetical protein